MDQLNFTHLRAVEDGQRITWRGGAPFSDWVLAWGDPSEASGNDSADVYRVHRVVLIGGPRPAHFFAGAVHEGFDARGTDLAKLIPETCRPVFEKALDFMYGAEIGRLEPAEVPLLYKVADVLQCPTLRNRVLGEVEDMIGSTSPEADAAVAEVLVGAAALGIDEFSDALIQNASVQSLRQGVLTLSSVAPQQLASIVPVFMDRISSGIAATWGGLEHEGGSVRLDGRIVHFRGGGTCIAWTYGEVLSGRHTWHIRVDDVHNASGFIALGVVAGPKDSSFVCDMDSWQQWYLYYSDDGKKRTKGEADLQDYSEPYMPSDVISIILDLNCWTLEFARNGHSCGIAYNDLTPGPYRVGAELGNSAVDMQITLTSYDCKSTGGYHSDYFCSSCFGALRASAKEERSAQSAAPRPESEERHLAAAATPLPPPPPISLPPPSPSPS